MENIKSIQSYLKQTFSSFARSASNDSKFKIFLTLLGGILVLRKTLNISCILYKNFLRSGYNLAQRYGVCSYVLICGNLNNLSKAFAVELAKRKFNIFFLTQSLDEVFNEDLKKTYQIDVIGKIADFSDKAAINEIIEKSLKELNISILVNNYNEGYKYGKLTELSEKRIEKILVENIYPNVYLTREILKKFQLRSQKSAIINVSSFNSEIPCPYFALNSANNAFFDLFTRSLASETNNLVDVISLKPLFLAKQRKNLGITTITHEECAKACLNDLGYEKNSYGHIKHKFQAERFLSMPEEKQEKYYANCLKKYLALNE